MLKSSVCHQMNGKFRFPAKWRQHRYLQRKSQANQSKNFCHKKSRQIVEKYQTICIESLKINNKDLTMQKAKTDTSCKSVSTIPKMQSGGCVLGGWNLLHNPNMQQLRRDREKTNIAKTALLQSLWIQGSQRS